LGDETRPFWDATKEAWLCLPNCNFVVFYPRSRCPACRSKFLEWVDLTGRGMICRRTIVRRAPGRWREHTPYVVAYVELDEGPRMVTNVVECDPEDVEIGMPVVVAFAPTQDGYALPRFSPNFAEWKGGPKDVREEIG
jgi:uncharacterized OB-fold protein